MRPGDYSATHCTWLRMLGPWITIVFMVALVTACSLIVPE